jgi:hypothetical protein
VRVRGHLIRSAIRSKTYSLLALTGLLAFDGAESS